MNEKKYTEDSSAGEQEFFLRPVGERVVIKVGKPDEKTESGIILPTSTEIQKYEGEVMAIGDLKGDMSIKVGDIALYSEFSRDTVVEFDGDEYIIININNVLAVRE